MKNQKVTSMSIELRNQIGLFTVDEVAAMLAVTPHTLAQWRAEKRGPDFVKLGRGVFYRKLDVENWVNANVYPAGGVISEITGEPEIAA